MLASMHIVSNISGSHLTSKSISMTNEANLCVIHPILSDERNSNNNSFDQLATDNSDRVFIKMIDAVDVLKTGIFLASITVPENRKTICNDTHHLDGNVERVNWDWWNSALMQWLSETSEMFKDLGRLVVKFEFKLHNRYFEMWEASIKNLHLQDHMDKATAVRIQEQMERSWHKEWTDTLWKGLDCFKLVAYYFHNFKF